LWTECPKFQKIWKKNRKALSRHLPRGEKIDAYNVAELTSLYVSGTATERLFLLLGVFCGWTQADIATAQVGMFDLKARVVCRKRSKTGVEGRWIIPSQLVELLAPRIAGKSKNDIAIVSDEGGPVLVYSARGGRVDLIRDAWDRMLERSGVRTLSFKYLRKTGSQMIREIANLEVSQMFLSHSDGSVAGRSYNIRVLDKLQTALLEMHRRLSPMFCEKSSTPATESLR
jgi:integrase